MRPVEVRQPRIRMAYAVPVTIDHSQTFASETCLCGFMTYARGEDANLRVRREFDAHPCPINRHE